MSKGLKRGKRRKPSVPDQVFTRGPFRFERHGRFVVGQNNATPEEHNRSMADLAARHDAVVSEIDGLVAQAAAEVARFDPLQLLHRAWWIRSARHINVEAEIEVGREDVVLMRMVDYVQSLIASTPPSDHVDELTDEGWAKLQDLVRRIFDRINVDYFICSTAKQRQGGAPVDKAYEEFSCLAQMYWCNVTTDQYQNHQVAALRELLAPQTQIIEELYGLTSEQLCDELGRIWHSLSLGLGDAFEAMNQLREKWAAALEADGVERVKDQDPEIVRAVLERHGLQELSDRARGMMLGLDLFDLGKVCTPTLPTRFLDDFSWSPGQDVEFFDAGDFRGWPLRIWPTFKKPFLKVGARYYCFDGSTLFDHFYRQLEKKVFKAGEALKQRWIEGRKRVTESLPFDYLGRLMPGAESLREVYYYLDESGKKKRYEADGLLMYDEHLFIVEVKSGAFTYTSPATDAPSHVQSLKNLVSDPAKQGHRVLRYLRSAPVVPLYDEAGNEVGSLRLSDFKRVIICAVTLDPFTEMAARIQHLNAIGVEVGDEPVWALSIDDLRVYADLFTSPLEFLHFVGQRQEAFRSRVLQLDDELDHVGMYLRHNQYARHAAGLVNNGKKAHLQFVGYREEIDRFFSRRMRLEDPKPLHQDMPNAMLHVLRHLAASTVPGRSAMASFLLDMAGNARDEIFKGLESEMAKPGTAPCRPYSTHGEVRLTAVNSSSARPLPQANLALARRHAQVLMVLHGESDRVFLHTSYDSDGSVSAVDWSFLRAADIHEADLGALRDEAEVVRSARLAKAGPKGVGRNEQCPCGSGLKYKKCCLQR